MRFVATAEPPRGDLLRANRQILSTRWAGLPSLRALVRHAIAPSFRPMLDALLAEAGNHDAMLAHHFVFPAPAGRGTDWAALGHGHAGAGVIPSAWSLPGSHFGRVREGALARLWNALVWSAGRLITAPLVDPVVNRLRVEHRLPRVRDVVFANHSPR